ncbi:hypothetical protein BJV74DRAFT_304319 [Russula compacta]|nr:hypothetical protein BJV74DRAFT_304319 [Russula compacta]
MQRGPAWNYSRHATPRHATPRHPTPFSLSPSLLIFLSFAASRSATTSMARAHATGRYRVIGDRVIVSKPRTEGAVTSMRNDEKDILIICTNDGANPAHCGREEGGGDAFTLGHQGYNDTPSVSSVRDREGKVRLFLLEGSGEKKLLSGVFFLKH